MSYIKEIKGGKEKINCNDVQNYCLNNIHENLTLEFKSGLIQNKKKEEFKRGLSITVSSFLNSQGGLLIIGFDEEERKIIPISNNSYITKELIDQVIHSSIYPRNHQINIYPIKCDGGNILIIDIEAGENTPYMAKDNRYYNRKSTGKVIMEGYEVDDHFHKRKIAIFELMPSIINRNSVFLTHRLHLGE